MTRTIAIIGLGNMGGPMVANLIKAGHRVVGYDVSAACCEAAKAGGAAIAKSAHEAVAEAGAKAATLTFMAGGTREAFAAAEPILGVMGKRVVHCGEAGAGQAAKICNNLMLGISMIGVAEAFVLAERIGLVPVALSGGASAPSAKCRAQPASRPAPRLVPTPPANTHHKPGFAAAL